MTRLERSRTRNGGLDWLFVAASLAVLAVFVRAMLFTPLEINQGAAQKILYIHAPAAWVAFLAFFVVAIAGGAYLAMRDERLDRFAASSAEVGLMFTTVVLITGPIWAKPVWGAWWTWDARLTSTLFLWFIYVGYQVLRGAIDDRAMRARYSAVLGILGALLVPFVHLSVYLYPRGIHPKPVLVSPEAIAAIGTEDAMMPPEMLTTLLAAVGAFTLLYVVFVRTRYQLATERDFVFAQRAAQ
jgi:heme exporter protein C